MDHFAGLDVSVKETSVCIVDETGRIVREVKVASEPEALLLVLKNPAYHFKRIGLEAGPLSQWLYSALAEADLPVVCVETGLQAVRRKRVVQAFRERHGVPDDECRLAMLEEEGFPSVLPSGSKPISPRGWLVSHRAGRPGVVHHAAARR